MVKCILVRLRILIVGRSNTPIVSSFAKYNTQIDSNHSVDIKNYKKLKGMIFKFT